MFKSHGMARRLFAFLFVLMAAGFGAFAYLSASAHIRQLESELTAAGNRSADLVVRSADYAMLRNQRELLTRMIRDIGSEPGIEVVRIYNKQGEISASSQADEEGTVVNMQAEACNACHVGDARPRRVPQREMSRIVEGEGHRSLGVIRPIYNRDDCSGPPCHAHVSEASVLGLLEIRMSMDHVDAAVAQTERQALIIGVLLVILVAGAAGFFVHQMVHRPLLNLASATRAVAQGKLNVRLPARGASELAAVAHDFNDMASALERAQQENRRWADTLERRVEEKAEELKRMHQRMLHVDRMASLGQLAATVAHELNNPLAGILTYARLLLRRGDESSPGREELRFIADETQRCGQIVKNLLLFAREGIGQTGPHDLSTLVTEGINVVRHHFELAGVTLQTQLAHVEITCDDAQIRQAVVALLMNAIEAMPDGGELGVEVNSVAGGATVTIRDTGIGIAAPDRPHIFEPFFTTKSSAQGVGLGLAVVYGIAAQHDGRIEVESTPGEGSQFTMYLLLPPSAGMSRKDESHA